MSKIKKRLQLFSRLIIEVSFIIILISMMKYFKMLHLVSFILKDRIWFYYQIHQYLGMFIKFFGDINFILWPAWLIVLLDTNIRFNNYRSKNIQKKLVSRNKVSDEIIGNKFQKDLFNEKKNIWVTAPAGNGKTYSLFDFLNKNKKIYEKVFYWDCTYNSYFENFVIKIFNFPIPIISLLVNSILTYRYDYIVFDDFNLLEHKKLVLVYKIINSFIYRDKNIIIMSHFSPNDLVKQIAENQEQANLYRNIIEKIEHNGVFQYDDKSNIYIPRNFLLTQIFHFEFNFNINNLRILQTIQNLEGDNSISSINEFIKDLEIIYSKSKDFIESTINLNDNIKNSIEFKDQIEALVEKSINYWNLQQEIGLEKNVNDSEIKKEIIDLIDSKIFTNSFDITLYKILLNIYCYGILQNKSKEIGGILKDLNNLFQITFTKKYHPYSINDFTDDNLLEYLKNEYFGKKMCIEMISDFDINIIEDKIRYSLNNINEFKNKKSIRSKFDFLFYSELPHALIYKIINNDLFSNNRIINEKLNKIIPEVRSAGYKIGEIVLNNNVLKSTLYINNRLNTFRLELDFIEKIKVYNHFLKLSLHYGNMNIEMIETINYEFTDFDTFYEMYVNMRTSLNIDRFNYSNNNTNIILTFDFLLKYIVLELDTRILNLTTMSNENKISNLNKYSNRIESCKTKDDYISLLKEIIYYEWESFYNNIINKVYYKKIHRIGMTCWELNFLLLKLLLEEKLDLEYSRIDEYGVEDFTNNFEKIIETFKEDKKKKKEKFKRLNDIFKI